MWEADGDRFHDVQYDDDDGRVAARAGLVADEQGRYAFWGVTPTPYPIRDDGPVGRMLDAQPDAPACGRPTFISW